MRFSFAVTLLVAVQSVAGFTPVAPSRWGGSIATTALRSTVEAEKAAAVDPVAVKEVAENVATQGVQSSRASQNQDIVPLSEAEINARFAKMMEKLQAKDRSSTQLNKEDIKVVFEDDDIVVVNKPAGVLSVPGKVANPSLSQAVFEAFGCEMGRADMMVVHRLGMDTSGLIVFAKTMQALRGMNEVFRTRAIERRYEALVCGHVEKDEGIINLPLMRDYEFPPFMRVSTDEQQRALVDLDAEKLDMKKVLDLPKESITKYEVVAREELEGRPVTRVILTSISGRTHQLNVHLAAFGHPIVGDSTYGINGDAASNGGLSEAELETLAANPNRASAELQKQIAEIANGKKSCVHAKSLKFRHPVSGKDLELSVDAPF